RRAAGCGARRTRASSSTSSNAAADSLEALSFALIESLPALLLFARAARVEAVVHALPVLRSTLALAGPLGGRHGRRGARRHALQLLWGGGRKRTLLSAFLHVSVALLLLACALGREAVTGAGLVLACGLALVDRRRWRARHARGVALQRVPSGCWWGRPGV